MSQPFIAFESLDNGLVARYMKCVEKERPAATGLGLPPGFHDEIERSIVKAIAIGRREGLIAPDERDEFEKEEDEIAEQEIEAERPPPKTEKYFAFEPASTFVADGDYQALITVVALARVEIEKAAREGAQPGYAAVGYPAPFAPR